jgi:hypothetical protein
VAVAAVVGVAAGFVLRPGKQPPVTASVAPPAPVPAPAPVEPAPAPMVTIRFDSEPQGAEVLVDGAVVGVTPLDRRLKRSEGTASVQLRLAGHDSYEARLSLAEDTSIKPALAKAAPSPAPPSAKPVAPPRPVPVAAPPKAPEPLDIKIER